jgi:hypothetical protein
MQLQFTILGTIFTIGAASVATFRSKDDAFNYTMGGVIAGAYSGLQGGRVHTVVYRGLGFGLVGLVCAVLSESKAYNRNTIDAALTKRFAFYTAEKDEKAEGK